LRSRWLLFPLILIIGLAGTALAADYAVEVVPPPAKSAAPGEFVTQVFTVTNQGTHDDTYDLQVTAPQGWSLLGLPGQLSLAAGESAKVFISVPIPATAAAGEYELTLRATSQADPTVSDEATCTIEVVEAAGVRVIPPAGKEVQPGQTVIYTFIVENTGNLPDIFELEASSSRGYPVEVSPQSLSLLYGERGEVRVSLAIPIEATPGVDRLTLRATATKYPQIFGEGSVLTRVLPPGPEAVTGTLFWTLPSEIEVGASLAEPLQVGDLEMRLHSSGRIPKLLNLDLEIKDLTEVQTASFALTLRPDPPGPFAASISKSSESIGIGLRGGLPGGGIGLSFLDILQTEAYKVTGSLALGIGGFAIDGTGAMSNLAGVVDYAERLDLSWRTGDLRLKTRLFRTGPDFYGGEKDTEGALAAMSLSTTWLALLSSYGYSRDNVEDEPLPVVTVGKEVTRLACALHLGELALSLGYSLESFASNDSPATTDREHSKATLGFSGSLPPLSFSFSFSTRTETIHDRGAIDDDGDGLYDEDPVDGIDNDLDGLTDEDGPTDDRFDITGVNIGFLISQGGLYGRFAVSQETIRSPAAIEDQSFKTMFGLGFHGDSVNGSLGLSLEEERTSLSFGVNVKATPDTRLYFSQCLSTHGLTGETTHQWEIGLASRFAMPTPFAVKGRIEGHLFVDSNSNGRYDPGEEGIPGVIIVADNTEVLTGADGLFRFPPLWPGWYELRIKELPAGLVPAVELPIWVKLEAGETERVDLPLHRVATIEGLVFDDADRNGVRDEGEAGLAHVRVMLSSNGALPQSVWTNPQGRFSFVNLEPGEYLVRLDAATLPERYEPTTPAEVRVELTAGEHEWVEFGAAKKERPLVITYNPIAEFTFSPERPHAGETVTFDGSASYDPDGEIVKYEWDFDNDGVTDAQGRVVEWVFAQPGSYPVRLTVTDNDGFKSSVTKEVPVQ